MVAIHDALLPDGKVVAWDASNLNASELHEDDGSHVHARDRVRPGDGDADRGVGPGHNIFCAGLAHLTDGTLFTAGGNADIYSNGIATTYTFDYATEPWTPGHDMAFPRWYPSVTPLTNGEMLITGGRPWIPEVRRTDGTIRQLSSQTGTMDVPFYPWMDVAPDGRVFYSGPDDKLRKLDPAGPGAWQDFGPRGDGENRDYGSHALYDVGKILVAGGGPSSKTARTIDINGATPQVSTTSPMAFARRQFNLTTLADGTVLATGGNSTGAQYIDMNGGVYNAELWNPATGQWTTLAAEQVTRQYHSTRAAAARRPRAVGRRRRSATTATTSATSGRTHRSSRRRTCSRRTARASWRRVPESARRRARCHTAPRSRSRPRMRPRSARWRCSGSGPSRTRTISSSATYRSPSAPATAS